MKLKTIEPPRTFRPSGAQGPEIAHVADIELAADEQVTVKTESGAEVDVVRKNWGFYPLPSLNGRLASFNLFPALAVNPQGKCYVLLVEDGKRQQFEAYLDQEDMKVLAWLGDKIPD